MKFAETIYDIPNAFAADPLTGEDLDVYYDGETIPVRTGDEYISPIENIYDACHEVVENNVFLLLGHKGCGKSTELNKLAERLVRDKYPTVIINCGNDLDLQNPVYSDLLILMAEALIKIAQDNAIELAAADVKFVLDFWTVDVEETTEIKKSLDAELSAGASVANPNLLKSVLDVFFGIKGNLKYSRERSNTYKKEIEKRPSEWQNVINSIANQIRDELDGRQPVVIFEDLDKLDLAVDEQIPWDIFNTHAKNLNGFNFPVIYTFPISLSYDPQFKSVASFFHVESLPMIKQKNIDGSPYKAGYNTIVNIVKKRAFLSLFEDKALDLAIDKTGGSLRDLFEIIRTASTRARRRTNRNVNVEKQISIEDIEKALQLARSDLSKRIDGNDYGFLADIYNGNKTEIEDRAHLLQMLKAGAVLEYNGERWNDVHPLVADFLKDIGKIK